MTEYALVEGYYGSSPVLSEGTRQIKVKPSSRERIAAYVKKFALGAVNKINTVLDTIDSRIDLLINRMVKLESSRPIKLPQIMAKNTMVNASKFNSYASPVQVSADPIVTPAVVGDYNFQPVEDVGAEKENVPAENAVMESAAVTESPNVAAPQSEIDVTVPIEPVIGSVNDDVIPVVAEPVEEEAVPRTEEVQLVESVPVVDAIPTIDGASTNKEIATMPENPVVEPLSFEGIDTGQYATNTTEFNPNDGVLFEVQPNSETSSYETGVDQYEKPAVDLFEQGDPSSYLDAVDKAITAARAFVPRGGNVARVEPYTQKIGFDDHGNLIGAGDEYNTPEKYSVARVVSSYSPDENHPAKEMPVIDEKVHEPETTSYVVVDGQKTLENLRALREKIKTLKEKQGASDIRAQEASDRAQEAGQRAQEAKRTFEKVVGDAIAREEATITQIEEAIRASEGQAEEFESSARELYDQAKYYTDQTEQVRMGRI